MIDLQEAKEFLEYIKKENISKFGTDKLILPFEPRIKHQKVGTVKAEED